MKAVDRILGEGARRPPNKGEQTNPFLAYMYAKNVVGGRWPEGEAVIAQNPEIAYDYAKNIVKGRWPEGESIIMTDDDKAYRYSREIIKGRFLAAEETLARSQGDAKRWYLERYPEAKDDWVMNGWMDWLDT